MINRCDNCGGSLIFNPASGCVECKKCHKVFVISTEKLNFHNIISMTESIKDLELEHKELSMKCPRCGAIIGGDVAKIADVCRYCGASWVEVFADDTMLKPDGVIPYMFDKEEAREFFWDGLKGIPFVPNALRKKDVKLDIQSIYIPAFIFKCMSNNKYVGKLEKTYIEKGNAHVDIYPISGVCKVYDNDLIVECSNYITQERMNKIKPYYLNTLTKFNNNFVMGYSVDHLNMKLSEAREVARKLHESKIRDAILKKYDYSSVKRLEYTTEYGPVSYAYAILPTYKITYTYKKKQYDTYMNGQTGKICNNVPRSKGKIMATLLAIVMAVTGIMLLFVKLIQG